MSKLRLLFFILIFGSVAKASGKRTIPIIVAHITNIEKAININRRVLGSMISYTGRLPNGFIIIAIKRHVKNEGTSYNCTSVHYETPETIHEKSTNPKEDFCTIVRLHNLRKLKK